MYKRQTHIKLMHVIMVLKQTASELEISKLTKSMTVMRSTLVKKNSCKVTLQKIKMFAEKTLELADHHLDDPKRPKLDLLMKRLRPK